MDKKETLLIVEDNQLLCQGLQEILEMDGYTVLSAANGREALERMNQISPDLILSDVAMPEMDGLEFFRKVRNKQEWMSIPFVFLTARGEIEDILAAKDLGAEDYLIKPLSRDELSTAVQARLSRSQELRVAQLHQAYESSLTVLANAIEARDQYKSGHVERVLAYAQMFGQKLGLTNREMDQLRFGAILHDIGKIHIPESMLGRPGLLTPTEMNEVKRHSLTGVEMIKDIPHLTPAVPVVRSHHESWDGSGYPDRLLGEQIPLVARITSLADTFDALTTNRPYRAAMTPEQALTDIISKSGTRYDPAVVAALQSSWKTGAVQSVMRNWPTTFG